jgi:cold-inducible RNA-binding protein
VRRLYSTSAVASTARNRAPQSSSHEIVKGNRTVGNRLFVGNLSFSTSQETVEAAFAAVGEVREVALPTDRETGRPRGFAFVTMADSQGAQNAISQLNGSELDGRQIRVDEAQERSGGGGGFRGGGGGGGFRGGGGGGGGGYGGGRKSGGGSRRGSRDRF